MEREPWAGADWTRVPSSCVALSRLLPGATVPGFQNVKDDIVAVGGYDVEVVCMLRGVCSNHDMDAREDLPKVSIETEQDWKRIQSNLSEALSVRLDKELESRGQPGDKEALSPHIEQFLETLFDIARPNLRINGRTTEEPSQDDDVEPFDEALDRYIWSLSDQRLKWDKDVAARRRTRPREIEGLISDINAQHDSAELDVAQEDPTYDDVPAKEIDPELQEVFSRAASLTAQLSQSISLQHERATRAKSAFQEVKALKP